MEVRRGVVRACKHVAQGRWDVSQLLIRLVSLTFRYRVS